MPIIKYEFVKAMNRKQLFISNMAISSIMMIRLFCISNAPATFQKYLNKILAKKLDIFNIIYLNNILIYIKNSGQLYIDVVS